MSCYNNRENYNFLSSRAVSGKKIMSFSDTKTQPESTAFLLRNFLSEGVNSVKRRAFQMFFMFNSFTSGKPDLTSELVHEYPLTARAIFEPFINGYGKYNASINYSKELNVIRMNVVRYMKKVVGCGAVNVIFRSETASPLTDEISCYITDDNTRFGKPLKFSINTSGLHLEETATLTFTISLKFIENTINLAYTNCSEEFKKSGIHLESMDKRFNEAVLTYISNTVPQKIFRAMICGLYKEQMFISFACDVVSLYSKFMKTSIEILDKMENIQIPIDTENSTPSFNLKLISSIIKQGNLSELNPHTLLDVFEISDWEMNLFIKNFIRDNTFNPISAPKYSHLMQPQSADFIDQESRMTAGAIYVSKLNYCILALMLITKASIKESSRSKYAEMVKSGIGSLRSLSSASIVTNNKEIIVSEVSTQLSIMETAANNIIKLKRFSEKIVG